MFTLLGIYSFEVLQDCSCIYTTVRQGAQFHHLEAAYGTFHNVVIHLDEILKCNFSTIWYELQVGDWPLTKHPVEAKLWLFGSSEGIKQVLSSANLGKEITVSRGGLCSNAGRKSTVANAGLAPKL